MKINVTRSAGFCFGVRKAIEMAKGAAKKHKKVYMLGDIVHNEDVVRSLSQKGVRKVKRLPSKKNAVFLLRAHGTPAKTVKELKDKGYLLINATCPMVGEIHSIVKKMEAKGYPIIVIGDRKHDEVIGICGQTDTQSYIIEKEPDIKKLPAFKKAACVVQSTQEMEKVQRMQKKLQKKIKNLKFFNTICHATRTKQKEIKRLPLYNDVVLIIGSKTSANTRRLYEISRRLNHRTYWINASGEIKKRWFQNADSVGITAGASTPPERIKEIVEYVSSIK